MKPKGTQFGNYTLERSSQEGLTSTWDEYRLLHHRGGTPSVAGVMHVRMGAGGPGTTHYPSGQEGIAMTPKADRASHTGYDEGWARYTHGREAVKATREAQRSGLPAGSASLGAVHEAVLSSPHQIPLFHQEGGMKPTSMVDALIMTKGHRHMASTLLGVAQNRSVAEGRGDLRSPTDLSKHSARLVSGLKERGLLGKGVSSTRQNTIDFERPEPVSEVHPEREVSAREVRRGQSTMRSLVKRPRARAQPEQGKLF